jgi:hypothetical protein
VKPIRKLATITVCDAVFSIVVVVVVLLISLLTRFAEEPVILDRSLTARRGRKPLVTATRYSRARYPASSTTAVDPDAMHAVAY